MIGEEAIDFDEVKWMACTNRGYMVHVSSMADVQEKIQVNKIKNQQLTNFEIVLALCESHVTSNKPSKSFNSSRKCCLGKCFQRKNGN